MEDLVGNAPAFEFIRKVRRTIQKYRMIASGESLLVAVSGGPDSLALLRVLIDLRSEIDLTMSACHLNHGFRGEEAEQDAEYVRRVCGDMGVPCHVEFRDVPALMKQLRVGAEEAGRIARYQFFESVCLMTGARKVALGHTMDDQAETVLMRLVRGAGTAGLSGIPPVRGMYIRPLIEVTREEVEEFCRSRGLEPRIDRSNLKPIYFRNRVRHEVFPLLERDNPQLVRTLARTADLMREDADYLDATARKEIAEVARAQRDGGVVVDLIPFLRLHPALRRRVVRRILEDVGGKGLSFGHVEDVLALAEDGRAGRMLELPGSRVWSASGALYIEPAVPSWGTNEGKSQSWGPIVLNVPGITPLGEIGAMFEAIVVDRGQLVEEPTANRLPERAFIDYGLIRKPLEVRSRRPGDYFYPLGLGGRKKVGDFLTALKVPKHRRETVPLVVSGDDVVWVAGFRLDERFKVTAKTQKVLVLSVADISKADDWGRDPL